MKVLIYYPTTKKSRDFEGARARKNLKGACELLHFPYTDDPLSTDYDMLVIISVNAKVELVVRQALRDQKPIVVWALRCENDPEAQMIDYISGLPLLKKKVQRVMNLASAVIVPSELSKGFLRYAGVETPIEIVEDGVNFARYDKSKPLEMSIFYRYFQTTNKRPFIVSSGTYADVEGIQDLIKIARNMPEIDFYYFGDKSLGRWKLASFYKLEKTAPKNLHFTDIVTDDVFRSALMNAVAFLEVGHKFAGNMTLLDVAAAKLQVFARKQAIFPDIFINNKTAYLENNLDDIEKRLNEFLNHEIPSLVEEAYKAVKPYDLNHLGRKIRAIFDSVSKVS